MTTSLTNTESVIPGTHKLGEKSEYSPLDNPEENIFGTEIKNGFDERNAIYLELQENHFSGRNTWEDL